MIGTREDMTRTLARLFVAASLAVGLVISFAGSANASTSAHHHFDNPGPMAVCADRVWVINLSNNSVTEINETSGAVIHVLDSSSFDFAEPVALGCGGDHLWVVSRRGVAGQGGAVTEINAVSGHLIRVVSNPAYEFDSPNAIAVGGSHLWITNGATPAQPPAFGGATGNSVTELNASNGSLVRVIRDPKDKISYPDAVVLLGSHVWVGNSLGNSVTELRSSDGSLVRVIAIKGARATVGAAALNDSPQSLLVTGSNFLVETGNSVRELEGTNGSQLRDVTTFKNPKNGYCAIAANSSDVWTATCAASGSVSEIDIATGDRVRVINAASDDLGQGQGIAFSPGDVWVASWYRSVVVELDMTTGALVRLIR
jgi:hypothetical protein